MKFSVFSQKIRVKLLLVVGALLLGTLTMYYTHFLVNKLAEREQKLIDLYAKGLQNVANDDNSGNLTFLFQEIIQAKNSVPVILTDAKGTPISYKNIDMPASVSKSEEQVILQKELNQMRNEYPPIVVDYAPGLQNFIYYRNSDLLVQLRYYPVIQLLVFIIFAFLAYLSFSYSKRAEQNRVWVGMAKETAHQLGTPLSSLMAWVELFKSDERFENDQVIVELEKDIQRLETITARFSNIGSVPQLKSENIKEVIHTSVGYLQSRLSKKVVFELPDLHSEALIVQLNTPLFDWVIENICKNAVDAMSGVGKISISVQKGEKGKVLIDIQDTGKGIPKKEIEQVFQPGFTTKQRGWGLGLTLVKRIIENYHGGKIVVLTSEPNIGTTFRITLLSAA